MKSETVDEVGWLDPGCPGISHRICSPFKIYAGATDSAEQTPMTAVATAAAARQLHRTIFSVVLFD